MRACNDRRRIATDAKIAETCTGHGRYSGTASASTVLVHSDPDHLLRSFGQGLVRFHLPPWAPPICHLIRANALAATVSAFLNSAYGCYGNRNAEPCLTWSFLAKSVAKEDCFSEVLEGTAFIVASFRMPKNALLGLK